MVISLGRGADLHMAQLMPLPLISCFSKIQIGFTLLVPAHPGSPGQRAVKRCVCVCVYSTVTNTNVVSLFNWLSFPEIPQVRCAVTPHKEPLETVKQTFFFEFG